MEKWTEQKTGGESVASCPSCRSVKGYEESTAINRVLGKKITACPNDCGATFEVRDTETHYESHCTKVLRRCKYQKIGCPWTGSNKQEHEIRCEFLKIEIATAQLKNIKAQCKKEIAEFNTQLDALITKMNRESQRCVSIIDIKLKEFRNYIDMVMSHKNSVEFWTRRVNDYRCAAAPIPGKNNSVRLHMKTKLCEDFTYEIYGCIENSKIPFPVSYLCVFANQVEQNIDAPNSLQPVCGRFVRPNEMQLLFSEAKTLRPGAKVLPTTEIRFRVAFTFL